MKFAKAKAPGKLYIAGEYAVVEPGHPSILITIDRFLSATVKEADDIGSIFSKNYLAHPLNWYRSEEQEMVLNQEKHPFSYIEAAIHTTEKYVSEQAVELTFFDLEIESHLDENGAKIGLGSSAAVTVATVKALLQFYELPYSSLLVYKLATLAHLAVKSNGSFGDIAAASFTGWIAYSSFDRDWVKTQREKSSISELVELEWPHLYIERLEQPENLEVLIGWTGSPASTTDLVNNVKQSHSSNQLSYADFLKESRKCVSQLIEAFRSHNLEMISTLITRNRFLLKQMGENSGVMIETPALKALCDISEQYGAVAKSSGAGGGDCGVAFLTHTKNEDLIIQQWKKHAIIPLSLSIYSE